MAENNDAWLGLLKWSLNYVDGTVPSTESPGYTQMSQEDKAFLEEVMKNGIIDEGERMKTILSSLVEFLDLILQKKEEIPKEIEDEDKEDKILELLEELQDIVEQIDFAKSFAGMGGIKFLIGCSGERSRVPKEVRRGCLSVLTTLCQNNPPVQFMMLEQGGISKLVDLYNSEFPPKALQTSDQKLEEVGNHDDSLRTKIVQCLSSSIRNHDVAEKIFCMNMQGIQLIESGLGMHSHNETLPHPCRSLRVKALFFLQALVTSDLSDSERVKLFAKAITYASDNFLKPDFDEDLEIREMTLSMLVRLLDKNLLGDCIENIESLLIDRGQKRIDSICQLNIEHQQEESDLWQSLMKGISNKPVAK